MMQVIQARCPNCNQMLRIPAAWLNQTIRCTYCKGAFQAKARASISATPPPPPAKLAAVAPALLPPPPPPRPIPFKPMVSGPLPPPSKPLPPAPSPPTPFASLPSARLPRPRGQGSWLPGIMVCLGVVLVGGVLGFLAWPEIGRMFQSGSPDGKSGDKQVAGGAKKDRSPTPSPSPGADPEKDKTKEPTEKPKIDEPKKEPKKDEAKVTPPKKGPPKKEPPKKEPGKVDPPKADPPKMEPDPPVVSKGGEFPRRALLINVSNYLLFNPLAYGQDKDGKKPGGSTKAVANRLLLPPMNFPRSQVFELADAKAGQSTSKVVVEAAIADFLSTAREQDRILLLFTGHGMEIGDDAFLVPVDGNRKDPASLIKLEWVYEKLKECKARQKVLILDVFRYPPARGEEIEGTGAMTEGFLTQLNKAPMGVQVWASCGKDQKALELENGSLFLQVFNQATREVKVGIARPEETIPVVDLLPIVNKALKERLGEKAEQVSLMIGSEETGKAFVPDEPLAKGITFKDAGGGDPTKRELVRGVLEELNLMPPIRGSRKALPVGTIVPFVGGKLKEYEADYTDLKELESAILADKDKYPIRAAYFKAVEALKATASLEIRENQPAPINDALKAKTAEEQLVPGKLDLMLKNILAELDEVEEKERGKETSKRWLANFDFAKAMIKAKLVYLNEYNYLLAGIRADRMPELEGASGWRVATSKKLASTEGPIKKLNKELPKIWDKIAKDYKDTPWAVLAQRESMTAMGLEWRAAKE